MADILSFTFEYPLDYCRKWAKYGISERTNGRTARRQLDHARPITALCEMGSATFAGRLGLALAAIEANRCP